MVKAFGFSLNISLPVVCEVLTEIDFTHSHKKTPTSLHLCGYQIKKGGLSNNPKTHLEYGE
jgi:hypothetical protein